MGYTPRGLHKKIALCLIVVVFFAISAVVTEARERHSGGALADIVSIKKAVAARIHCPITDWFIAIRGSDAVVQFADGPAAGGVAGLVRIGGLWTVTCAGNGKVPATRCAMPAAVFARLNAQTNRLMSQP